MATPAFDAVGVVVTDMAAAVAFYRRVGVPFSDDVDLTDGHLEAPLGPGMRLMLDTVAGIRDFAPEYAPVLGNRIAFAARLDSPAEVDQLYAELAADGFGKQEPWDAPWGPGGMRYCSVVDPDGIQVDLYAAGRSGS